MTDNTELKALLAKATASEWRFEGNRDYCIWAGENIISLADGSNGVGLEADDARIAVAAVNALPHLLAADEERERLAAENERLRGVLATAEDAMREMFRYYDGGEMRGSYDGKPERMKLRAAWYELRAALTKPSEE